MCCFRLEGDFPNQEVRLAHPKGMVDKATFRQLCGEDYLMSTEEADLLLQKHGLGKLKRVEKREGNFLNSVYDCETDQGSSYIVKIRFRGGHETLEADQKVTVVLREVLPVAHICLLDHDCDILPHPCLILSKLQGELAERIFEGSEHSVRIAVSRRMGEIMAVMHSLPVTSDLAPDKNLFRLNCWKESVACGLYDRPDMRSEIDRIHPSFYGRLEELLSRISLPSFDEQLCLVWGDPKFHNFLVRRDEDDFIVSGVFDFESSGIGNRIFDFLYVEGNFRRGQADGIYRDPEYVEAFYGAYTDAGGVVPELSEQERVLRDVVLKANGGAWWWDGAKILPPRIGSVLDDVLIGLEELANGQA